MGRAQAPRKADNRGMPSQDTLSTLDTTRTDGRRIRAVRPLLTPAILQEWLPAPEAAQDLVEASRHAISRVLHGQDDRLVVVVICNLARFQSFM